MSYLLRRTKSLDPKGSTMSRLSGDTGVNLWKRERLQSVLYKAVKHEDVEMAAKCLKMGAVDVNTRYEPLGQTVLHMVSITGESRLCALFCRADADPNLADDRLFRPIHWACVQGHKTVVRILINHAADLRLVNEYGDAAIHTAVRHDHVHLLPYLLGPPFQRLYLPTRNGSHIEIDQVNLQNENGDAPLHIAVALGRKRMAKKLIRLGASGHIRNNQGLIPLDLAVEKRNAGLIRLLRKNFNSVAAPPSSIFTEESSSNSMTRKDEIKAVAEPSPAVVVQNGKENIQKTEEKEMVSTAKTNMIQRASDQKSFDLQLTGRSLPPDKWKLPTPIVAKGPTNTVIERKNHTSISTTTKLRNFCYHHHIEDPTKVVELDPLPNNSWATHSDNIVAEEQAIFRPKMKPSTSSNGVSLGKLPISRNGHHSASLEEKLNEITLKHSDCLSRRISELSRSVQDQLQIMNENLHKQEESIKKSIKKSEKAKSAINLIPTPPTQPPRPPLPQSIPIPVTIEKSPKRVNIQDPKLNRDFRETWIRDERVFIVKKKPKQKKWMKTKKKTLESTTTSTTDEESSSITSSASFSSRVNEKFEELVKNSRNSSRSNSRMANYQPYQFNDIFGSRVGRVSPRIREIQEQLRRAQRRAALRKFDEDGNYVCPMTEESN